jgi:homoserine kinase
MMSMGRSDSLTAPSVKLPRGFKRLKAACRVPASVANLGPGFDCLGLALQMFDEVAVELAGAKDFVETDGEGGATLPTDSSNLIIKSMHVALDRLGRKPVPVHVRCHKRIPLQRGLGSSSAAIVAGVFLANELCGRPMDREALFQTCAEIEGHPDNVSPALLGGLTVSIGDGPENFQTLSVEHDSLNKWKYVVAIPEFMVNTAKARKALPKSVTLKDAAFNVGRASMVVAALLKGPGKSANSVLREAMNDRLHQPARAKLIPGRDEVLAAAYDAGALGACVSGSGPTMLAIAGKWANRIGEAMVDAFKQAGLESRYEVLNFEPSGTISLGVHNF